MKRGRIFLIVFAVLAAHVVLFCFLADKHPLPKSEYIPPPNFVAKEARATDPGTGEKLVYHEYTVSTKLQEHVASGNGE